MVTIGPGRPPRGATISGGQFEGRGRQFLRSLTERLSGSLRRLTRTRRPAPANRRRRPVTARRRSRSSQPASEAVTMPGGVTRIARGIQVPSPRPRPGRPPARRRARRGQRQCSAALERSFKSTSSAGFSSTRGRPAGDSLAT